jgi:hypothetical protein
MAHTLAENHMQYFDTMRFMKIQSVRFQENPQQMENKWNYPGSLDEQAVLNQIKCRNPRKKTDARVSCDPTKLLLEN